MTFFLLAFAISFAFSKLPAMPLFSIDLRDVLCGFGPLLGGLICYRLFDTSTRYSVGGSQPIKAWGIVLLSALTFIFTNSKSSLSANLLFAVSQIVYCFGEEFGWRHYLQSATKPLNKWLQIALIGLIWFAWHFSWLEDPIHAMLGQNTSAPLPLAILIAIAMLVLFSAFLRWTIERTGSLLFPTIAHFVLKTNGPTTLVTIALVVAALLTWDKFRIGENPPTNPTN